MLEYNVSTSAKFLQSSSELVEGAVFCVPYPFCRSVYDWVDEDGPCSTKTWRPGAEWQLTSNYGDSDLFANAVGEVIYEIVSIHKPGDWPVRIFFTRKWKDPNGRIFGKRRLLVAVQSKFKRWIKGYPEAVTIDPDRDLDSLR